MDQSGQTGQPSQPPASGTPTSSRPFFAHHPTHTFTRDLGDVIVGGAQPPAKKRHTGIIIGIISLVVVIIVAIVVGIYIATQRSRIGQAQQSFAAYQRLLETGNQDNFNPESGWFIQAVAARTTTLPDTYDSNTYGATLRQAYDEFTSAYQVVADSTGNTLVNNLSYLTPTLNLTSVYLQRGTISQSVMTTYSTSGQSAAEAQIAELLEMSEDAPTSTVMMAEALQSYFSQEVQIYAVFAEQGCLVDGYLDTGCLGAIDPSQTNLDSLSTNLENTAQGLASIFTVLANSLVSETQTLQPLVEDING